MPELPFILTAKNIQELLQQTQLLMNEMFEERIGGANLGDVFEIGDDDILALRLASAGGLQKISSELLVKLLSTGGLQVTANGIAIKLKTAGGLETDADGIGIKLDGTSLTLSASGLKLSDPMVLGEITLDNDGLHILDTNASHDLIVSPGSDLTADRTLTITTGDSDRTITLAGNPTLADWFDQAVKQASSPTFANVSITNEVGAENIVLSIAEFANGFI